MSLGRGNRDLEGLAGTISGGVKRSGGISTGLLGFGDRLLGSMADDHPNDQANSNQDGE